MNISDFSTDANELAQQIIDVKAYATANYNKLGWDFIVDTLTIEQLGEVIGKRKNTRGAINAAFVYIKPLQAARGPLAPAHPATIDTVTAAATTKNDVTTDIVTLAPGEASAANESLTRKRAIAKRNREATEARIDALEDPAAARRAKRRGRAPGR